MAASRKKTAAAPRKPRKKRRTSAAPKSRGLAPAECRVAEPGDLGAQIESRGGAVLAAYREPLGGGTAVFAALPIERVKPTPFQRDLSAAHAKRLTDTIDKVGRFLDPIVAVPSGDGWWTPNGRHRLEAMTRLGARTITALVLPDPEIQYRILALNIEKAHNLREKSLEVIRMYRAMAGEGDARESACALEFEEPAFATLGICYEHNGRFAGGAYQPILKRVDGWLDEPLAGALKIREGRAGKIERLDTRIAEIVKDLQGRGFKSPYLKAFVVARVNPLRFMKSLPPFDDALEDILGRADRFNVERVKPSDIAATGGGIEE